MDKQLTGAAASSAPTRLAVGINVIVLLLVVLGVVWQLNNSYRRALSEAAMSADALVQLKSRTLLTQFEMLDLVMERLERETRLAQLSDRHQLDLHVNFAEAADELPFVSRFLLLDRDARVLLSSDQIDSSHSPLPLCPPFPHTQAGVGHAVFDRHDGRSPDGCRLVGDVYTSHLMHDRGGELEYELVAVLHAELIGGGFFNEITWALGEQARYRIATWDGRFLLGFRNLPDGLSYEVVGDEGQDRRSLFSHRNAAAARGEVAGFDLQVEIAYSADEVLADQWRDGAVLTVGAAVLFLISWALFSWTIVRLLYRHERAISESEARYNRSLSYADVGAWQWDITTDQVHWSDQVYVLFGITKGEREPAIETFLSLVHPDDRQRVADAMRRSVEQGDEYDIVHRIVLRDGTVRWLQERGGVRRDGDGEPLNMNGVTVDITDQYRAQRALAESESRFRTAFDNTAIGNVIIDSKGIIVDANHAAEGIFGYSTSELVGNNVSILMPEPERSRHDDYIATYLSTGHGKIIGIGQDLRGMRKGGEIFPMHLGVGAMEIDGQVSFIGSISDLSEVKSLEAQLRHSQKMDAIGQLAGGVAHDFNNILGIAIGGLDLLKMKLKGQVSDDKSMGLLDKVHEALWRGAKMTANLLDFSRQDQGGAQTVDLNRLVARSLDLIRKSMTSSVLVEERLADGLWPVQIDPDDFQNALVNLAINARDAMPQGGTIRLETANISHLTSGEGLPATLRPGDYVRFSVSDDGTGMTPEILEKAFEPFFSTKGRGKGTGLGLSMVYSFAKRANGDIDVQSRPGAGTRIAVYLPRAADERPGSEPGQAAMGSRDDAIADGDAVLIVDDEEVLAEVAREMFISLGFTPLVANSANEALRLIEAGECDVRLLFSDIVMPELDGCHLALMVHRLQPDLPVLLTSGYAQKVAAESEDPQERAWCQRLVRERLPKPYDREGLRNRLLDLLPQAGR